MRTKFDQVINRLENCKFRTAYEMIEVRKDVCGEIKDEFKKAGDDLGNCGWGGDLIMDTAKRLAGMLGYEINPRTKLLSMKKSIREALREPGTYISPSGVKRRGVKVGKGC